MDEEKEVNTSNEMNENKELNIEQELTEKKGFSLFKFNRRYSDILINIFSVTFGVLLAAYINFLVEKKKETHEVNIFLSGLYEDLRSDLEELQSDMNSFQENEAAFYYFYRINSAEQLEKDSVNKYRNFIFNYVLFYPNSGRFDGFKSSGKLYYIENEVLRNEILDLYQETLPVLIGSTNYYNTQQERLRLYIEEVDNEKNRYDLLISPKGKIILMKCISLHSVIISMYKNSISKTEKILALIEKSRT